MGLFSEFSKIKMYLNPPMWSAHSPVDETLSFSASEVDPTNPANWKSPSTQVVSDTGNFVHLFDYTTNPGSVTYKGTQTLMFECEAVCTVKSSAVNTEVRLQWVKNGAPSGTRFVVGVIGNANQSTLLHASRRFELSTGDYLDFYFSADKESIITIEHAEWEVIAIKTVYP